MPKLEGEPVVRIHVMVFESDLEELRIRFGDQPGIGPSVRMIVRTFLKRLEQTKPLAQVTAEAQALAKVLEEIQI